MFLQTPIEELPSTKTQTIKKLKLLGIKNYFDLLNYFPYRFENYSLISPINRVQEGEKVTVVGTIKEVKNEVTKRHLWIQKFVVVDDSGQITAVFYNQRYLLSLFKKGMKVALSGEVKRLGYHLIIIPLEYEIINGDYNKIHTGRLIPIYPEKRGLSSRTLREKIFYILSQLNFNNDKINDFLPEKIIKYNHLINEHSAYFQIHYPQSQDYLHSARQRLAFDELFLLLLSHQLVKKKWEEEKSKNPFIIDQTIKNKVNQLIDNLSFKLTEAQHRVIGEILADFEKPFPMNRFLYGDVGSGKTVVAAIASYVSYLNGYQTLMMAPTEILANQHYQTITKLFANVKGLKISLLTASHKPKPDELKNSHLIIGTHALIQKKVNFEKVGLVIIDEQHRFGVNQRAQLRQKGINPHLLTMTATPIPRSLFLTFYGELSLSYIDQMPKGRLPIKTYVVPKDKRNDCYNWVKEKINKEKMQVYIVCPLIEESEVETLATVKAAKKEFHYLQTKIFPQYKLGLLHGRMKAEEKDIIMNNFKQGKIDILVTTSVIEVGIDVPNANIIIIEGSERFGLAQLHQLRGRVGRSDKQSYCFLFTEKDLPPVLSRLNFFTKNQNGMALADYDLKHRGPGEIYGLRQHGFINLKIASLTNFSLIEMVKNAVSYFLNNHQDKLNDKELNERLLPYQSDFISRD
jgi:ATP-dependent DNA helicase RecG